MVVKMNPAQPEAMLRGLGLTEYEIRAWLTLLRHGTLTAERISELGGIPLPRVYDTITELQRKGFVLVSKTRPKMFKTVDAKRALMHFVDVQKKQFEKKVVKLKDDAKVTLQTLTNIQSIQAAPEEKWSVWTIERRKNVQKFFEEQEKDAKKEIAVFSGDMSWLPERISSIRAAVRRGVKFRAIAQKPTKSSDQAVKNLKKAKQLGIAVRTGYTGLLRGNIIDGKIAAIAVKTPMAMGGMPGTDEMHKYELMIFDNPVIVAAFKENFEFWWETLK